MKTIPRLEARLLYRHRAYRSLEMMVVLVLIESWIRLDRLLALFPRVLNGSGFLHRPLPALIMK